MHAPGEGTRPSVPWLQLNEPILSSLVGAEKETVVCLCGFAPLREIAFQSCGGWDGEGFARRRG